jgi:hypothetical protein
VFCRFDFTNDEVTEGRIAKMSSDWLVASSPYAAGDKKLGEKPPTECELDFAVLRLSESVGDDSVEGTSRGWFHLTNAPLPEMNDAVLILQYPPQRPLSMSIGSVRESSTTFRIHYAASTTNGSSGSPVLSAALQLIALHHAGDPNWRHAAEFNQGIPVGLIKNWLDENRKDLAAQFNTQSRGSTRTPAVGGKKELLLEAGLAYDTKLWAQVSISLFLPAIILGAAIILRHSILGARVLPGLAALFLLAVLIIQLWSYSFAIWDAQRGAISDSLLVRRSFAFAGVLFTVLTVITSAWASGLIDH